ncbi:unnamed protein product, partial [Prorocentrum cordatum]
APTAGWPPLAGPLRERTNSRVHVPSLLAAAGLLDQQEAAGWSTHPLTHDWWQPTVEALQQADPVPAETFAQGLEFAGASPGAIYAVIAAGGGARPGHVHLPPAVRALADSAGYIDNLAQDLLLELFGGVVLARGVDRRADELRDPARREAGQQRIPKEQLLERFTRFEAGDWAQLLTEAQPGPPRRPPERDANGQSRAPEARRGRAPDENEELRSRCERARELIRLGEVSAAQQALTASAVAPGTQATLDELRDPARRLQQPREQLSERAARAPPQGLASLEPDRLLTNVRRSRRGAAPGPSGMTGEHLQTLLDDEHCCDLLHHAATLLARAEIPGPVAEALRLGRLTALRKSNGRARGIVTGDVFRIPHVGDLQSSWLLLSMCANPRANFFLRALAPEDTAAFAAAHDDNLANALADLLELPQEAVAEGTSARQRCQLPLCMGGLGLRSASRTAPAAWWASWADCAQMLRERCPELTNQICAALSELDRGPLPAAPGCLQQASRAKEHLSAHGFAAPNWHDLAQGPGPAGSAPCPGKAAREGARWQAASGWAGGVCEQHFSQEGRRGPRLLLGKQAYQLEGIAAPPASDLAGVREERQWEPEAPAQGCQGSGGESKQVHGLFVLQQRLEVLNADPRRAVRVLVSRQLRLLGRLWRWERRRRRRVYPEAWVAQLVCACVNSSCEHAAAEGFEEEVLHQRLYVAGAAVRHCLDDWRKGYVPWALSSVCSKHRWYFPGPSVDGAKVVRHGWRAKLKPCGLYPEQNTWWGLFLRRDWRRAAGSWVAGLAHSNASVTPSRVAAAFGGVALVLLLVVVHVVVVLVAALCCALVFLRVVLVAVVDVVAAAVLLVALVLLRVVLVVAVVALLVQHRGLPLDGSGILVLATLCGPLAGVGSAAFLFRWRARWRALGCRVGLSVSSVPTPACLMTVEPVLEVGLSPGESFLLPHGLGMFVVGDHRAACPRAGVLKKRSIPLEKAAARICREAGGRVAENQLLRDLNVDGVDPRDGRKIEVIANGLPLWGGAQLAIDATLVSPVRTDGTAQPRAADEDGVQLAVARGRKEATYPELIGSRRCRLVVLGLEVGGRWSEEALTFVRLLARTRARSAPQRLRASARAAYLHRWTGLAAVAAQRAFAATLLELPPHTLAVDGDKPHLADLLADARYTETP